MSRVYVYCVGNQPYVVTDASGRAPILEATEMCRKRADALFRRSEGRLKQVPKVTQHLVEYMASLDEE